MPKELGVAWRIRQELLDVEYRLLGLLLAIHDDRWDWDSSGSVHNPGPNQLIDILAHWPPTTISSSSMILFELKTNWETAGVPNEPENPSTTLTLIEQAISKILQEAVEREEERNRIKI